MKRNSSKVEKILTPNNRKDLNEWLQSYGYDVNNFHRQSSDCVLVAKMIKKLFPKMIDLYEYPERNAINLKVKNWEKLNARVLVKLNLQQRPADLQKYVNGNKDALSYLIFSLIQISRDLSDTGKNAAGDAPQRDTTIDRQPVVVNVDRVVNNETVKVEQKMISIVAYDVAKQEQKQIDDAITAANKRLLELEALVKDKTEEIDNLCSELARETIKTMEMDKKGNKDNSVAEEKETCEEPVGAIDSMQPALKNLEATESKESLESGISMGSH